MFLRYSSRYVCLSVSTLTQKCVLSETSPYYLILLISKHMVSIKKNQLPFLFRDYRSSRVGFNLQTETRQISLNSTYVSIKPYLYEGCYYTRVLN